jgi:hypothetical protein
MTRAMLIVALLLAATDLAVAQQSTTRSFYDRNGGFAGSSVTTPRGQVQGSGTSSFYDSSGHFTGSAIRNSDGTTSLYDRNGHFTGSSTSTTQPR